MQKKSFIIISLILIFTVKVYSQNSIIGTLYDMQDIPIDDVHIELTEKDSLKYGTTTDTKGHFKIDNISDGRYKLIIQHINYTEHKQDILITGDTIIGIIHLNNKFYELEGIKIVSNKRFVKTSSNLISYKIPKVISNSSTSSFQLLQHIPNVNANIFERTLEVNGENNVYIEVNGIHRTMDYLNNISSNDIKEIIVIENPSGKYLSKDVSSVINIITNKKERGYSGYLGTRLSPILEYGLTYGSILYSTPKFSFQLGGQNFFFDEQKHHSKRTIKRKSTGSDLELIKTSNNYPFKYVGNNINIGTDYRVSNNSTLIFEYTNTSNEYSLDNLIKGEYYRDGNKSQTSKSTLKNESNTKNHTYAIQYQHKDDKNSLSINLDYNNFVSSYINDYTEQFDHSKNVNNQNFHNTRKYLNTFIDYEYVINRLGRLEIGARYNNQYIDLTSTYNVDKNNNTLHLKENRYVAYTTLNITRLKRLNILLGLNMDYSNIEINSKTKNNYLFLLPNFTINYRPNNKHSLNLNYKLSREAPSIQSINPFERYTDGIKVTTGNPYLEPFYFNTTSLRYNISTGSLYITPEISYSFTNNYIAAIGTLNNNRTYYITYDNIARYNVIQFKLHTEKNVFEWWRLKASISLNKSKYYDNSIDRKLFSYGYQIQSTFTHKSLSANINFYRKADDLSSNMIYTPPMESSFYAQWKIQKWISFNAGVRYIVPWAEEYNIESTNYSENFQKSINERDMQAFIGLSINFNKGSKTNKRTRKSIGNIEDAQMHERR